jgi:CheY-like chemotaxis protein
MDLAIIVKTRAALLFTSSIDVTAREILLENLISIVFASYGVAILLLAVTVVLAWFETRHYAGGSIKGATTARALPASQEASRKIGQPNQKRVLLIDDSEDVMLLVGHALERHGRGEYGLTWAKCLKDALRELTKGGLDVVLLDLGLPESSGSISYACVRGCAPEVPVLVVTGDDCQETAYSVVAAGADGYLLKQQISGHLLVRAIETVLRTQKRPPQMNLKRFVSGR